jgi:hypothetical protein
VNADPLAIFRGPVYLPEIHLKINKLIRCIRKEFGHKPFPHLFGVTVLVVFPETGFLKLSAVQKDI